MRKMDQIRVPHVLIFPYPAQGHVNSMLKLSELLALSGLHVTFLNTEYNQNSLLRFTDTGTRFQRYPMFQFSTISDGLPADHTRTFSDLKDMVHNIHRVVQPSFQKMFSECLKSSKGPPVTCIIADGLLTFAIDVAKELGIPSINFRTTSACHFWACYCIPKVIESGEIPFQGVGIGEFFNKIKTVIQPSFREMLVSGQFESAERPPLSCILADGLLTFTIDMARELGIPSISFRTTSICYFWACYCIPKVIKAGEIPFTEDVDLDELVTSVPGMEGFVRRRDLPSFYRAKDLNDVGLNLVLTETQNSTKASAHILNTFEDLEGPILSQMRAHFPKIYTIGPLHALLDSRRKQFESTHSSSSSNNSLLEVDRSCITWLDSQSSNSVIYVSFGSVIFMTRKQMLEFWHGLVNSGVRFLWVIRPDSVTDKDEEFETPEELSEGTKARGYMVEWSPQEEVLQHPAVGGFLTHSGWNSTLESIVTGVPMICWPQFADQQTNSRFVSEAWKIGFDMKDQCDRSIVERLVRDLMEDKREKIVRSSDKMKELAQKSVSKGGSSYCNLDELIQDIKLMKIGVSKIYQHSQAG